MAVIVRLNLTCDIFVPGWKGEATYKLFLAMLIKSWYLKQCSRTMGSGRPSDWAEYGESSTADPGQAKTPFGPETKTLEQEVALQ
jgi:hypothetical protein